VSAVTKTDVAPSVASNNANVTFAENQTATNTGTWSDYDDGVTLSASIGTVTENSNGTWSWSQSPNLGDSAYTVTITATNVDNSFVDGLQDGSVTIAYTAVAGATCETTTTTTSTTTPASRGTMKHEMPRVPGGASGTRASTMWTIWSVRSCSP